MIDRSMGRAGMDGDLTPGGDVLVGLTQSDLDSDLVLYLTELVSGLVQFLDQHSYNNRKE